MTFKYHYLVLLISLIPFMANCQQFEVRKVNGGFEIVENQKKIFFYQQTPKTVNGMFERAGYIHPLYGCNGEVVTEDAPLDHPYHRGIFWAWHQIKIFGKNIADGWISENIFFSMPNVSYEYLNNALRFHAGLFWQYKPQGLDSINILKDSVTITVLPANNNFQIIDFDIFLLPLVKGLQIGGSNDFKGYGGFCVRLKTPNNFEIQSSKKIVSVKERAIKAGNWVDFKGSFNDSSHTTSGIAIFSHASNPKINQKWILRKKKSMQNAVFPGRKAILLPEKGLHLKYAVVIHNSDLNISAIDSLYQLHHQMN